MLLRSSSGDIPPKKKKKRMTRFPNLCSIIFRNCGEVEPATWDEKDKEQVRLWAISERWTHLVEDCKTEKS